MDNIIYSIISKDDMNILYDLPKIIMNSDCIKGFDFESD